MIAARRGCSTASRTKIRTRTIQTRTAFEAEDLFAYRKQIEWVQEIQLKLVQGHIVIAAIDTEVFDAQGGRLDPVLNADLYLHYSRVHPGWEAVSDPVHHVGR